MAVVIQATMDSSKAEAGLKKIATEAEKTGATVKRMGEQTKVAGDMAVQGLGSILGQVAGINPAMVQLADQATRTIPLLGKVADGVKLLLGKGMPLISIASSAAMIANESTKLIAEELPANSWIRKTMEMADSAESGIMEKGIAKAYLAVNQGLAGLVDKASQFKEGGIMGMIMGSSTGLGDANDIRQREKQLLDSSKLRMGVNQNFVELDKARKSIAQQRADAESQADVEKIKNTQTLNDEIGKLEASLAELADTEKLSAEEAAKVVGQIGRLMAQKTKLITEQAAAIKAMEDAKNEALEKRRQQLAELADANQKDKDARAWQTQLAAMHSVVDVQNQITALEEQQAELAKDKETSIDRLAGIQQQINSLRDKELDLARQLKDEQAAINDKYQEQLRIAKELQQVENDRIKDKLRASLAETGGSAGGGPNSPMAQQAARSQRGGGGYWFAPSMQQFQRNQGGQGLAGSFGGDGASAGGGGGLGDQLRAELDNPKLNRGEQFKVFKAVRDRWQARIDALNAKFDDEADALERMGADPRAFAQNEKNRGKALRGARKDMVANRGEMLGEAARGAVGDKFGKVLDVMRDRGQIDQQNVDLHKGEIDELAKLKQEGIDHAARLAILEKALNTVRGGGGNRRAQAQQAGMR